MAEPKVLTAEEAFIKTYNIEPGASKCDLSKPIFVKGFCEGKEQGRLEMWLELKPLIEASKELSAMPEFYSTEFARIVKNLKPLEVL